MQDKQMGPETHTPLQVFLSAFVLSSFGGLAALLRSNQEVTLRAVLSALMYSGGLGVVIALLLFNTFEGKGNIYVLLGISGLAGMGGMTLVDFIVQVLKKGGVEIVVHPKDTPAKGDGI
jgi:hypothetical protein